MSNTTVIAVILAYLTGSIPVGLIIAGLKNIDLRSVGSGNIGATNVSRALGKKWGYFCFALDVLKGFVPSFVCLFILNLDPLTPEKLMVWLVIGSSAIIGHIFPIFANFKGGKGVATSLGVALGIWPYYTIAAILVFIIWAIITMKSKYVSLGSIVGGLAFPLIITVIIYLNKSWDYKTLWPLLAVSCLISLAIIIRHKDNIKRLIQGTATKIGTKKP